MDFYNPKILSLPFLGLDIINAVAYHELLELNVDNIVYNSSGKGSTWFEIEMCNSKSVERYLNGFSLTIRNIAI